MAAPTEESTSINHKNSAAGDDKTPAAVKDSAKSPQANVKVEEQNTPKMGTLKKAKDDIQAPEQQHRYLGWVAWSALVLALLAGGVAGFNFQGLRGNRADDLAWVQQQQDSAQQLAALRSDLVLLSQTNEQLQKQVQSADLARQGLSLELEKVAKLAADKGKSPVYWRVAEVEYLLKVANDRVQLEHDKTTALMALRDADQRLKTEGDPGLIPVRQQITAEINGLRSVQEPDIAGLSVQLGELVGGVQTLPLIGFKLAEQQAENAKAGEKTSDWRELPKALWRDILSLFVIRHRDQPIEPMLPPDQQHYLAQNLALKFEQSRIALLSRDTPVYRRNLIEVREWIVHYFDKESAAVKQVLAQLIQLETVELQPTLPDISGSLRTLRAWLASQTQASSRMSGGQG